MNNLQVLLLSKCTWAIKAQNSQAAQREYSTMKINNNVKTYSNLMSKWTYSILARKRKI